MVGPPAPASPRAEVFYARWIAESERHRADCPICARSSGDCPTMEHRFLRLARDAP